MGVPGEEDRLCSQAARLSVLKMPVLPRLAHRSSKMFLCRYDKTSVTFIQEGKGSGIFSSIL